MANLWFVRFTNDDETYVALGRNAERMPVFQVGESSSIRTKMFFPACMKFMPDADVEEGPHRDMTSKKARRQYGIKTKKQMMAARPGGLLPSRTLPVQ